MVHFRRFAFSFVIAVLAFSAATRPGDTQAEGFLSQGVFAPSQGRITSNLEILRIENVGFTWQTVSLENTYSNAIPICTYVLPSDSDNPVAVRINNITASSFDIKIQQPQNSSAVTASDVFCIVAEEGSHTLPDTNNTIFEAHTVLSTTTSGNSAGGWNNGTNVSGDIVELYTNPVVLGQVISYNHPEFSLFWSYDCENRAYPPFDTGMGDGICVGKHIGQVIPPSPISRNTESIGYIVVEGDPDGVGGNNPVGILSPSGVQYEVFLGSNTIDGVDNSGSFYTLSTSGYTIGVATQSAMQGNNGGWAVLYGSTPLDANQIDLAIDEDTLGDSERAHVGENVATGCFNQILDYPGSKPR